MLEALSGKTILLTGASGFIGGRLLKRLAQVPGARLIVHTRGQVPTVSNSNVLFISAPLVSLDASVWHRLGVDRCDIVVHLAGFVLKQVSAAPTYPAIYESSIMATKALLDGLPSCPERVVYSSSLDVYAPPPVGQRISESSPLDPRTVYAASKLFLEWVIREHSQAKGYSACILRLGHIYGPGEEAFHRLVPESIRRMLKGEPALLLGDPEIERDYLFVDDAVEAILRSLSVSPAPGLLNIVRGESIRVEEVLNALARVIDDGARFERRDAEAPKHSLRFDAARMWATLGKWPLVPFEEGLRREVEHMRAHCVGP